MKEKQETNFLLVNKKSLKFSKAMDKIVTHANKFLWIYVKLTLSIYCEFVFKVIGHVFEMPWLSGVIEEEGITYCQAIFYFVAWTYHDIVCITNGKANVANWVHNLLLDNYLFPSSQ
jgi:hypothetical protein